MAEEEGGQLNSFEVALLIGGAILISLLTVFFAACFVGKSKKKRAEETRAKVEEMRERRASRRMSANNEWLEDALRAAAEIEGDTPTPGRRSIREIDANELMGRRSSVSSVNSQRSEGAGRQSRRNSTSRPNTVDGERLATRAMSQHGPRPSLARLGSDRSLRRSQSAGAPGDSPEQRLRGASQGGFDDMATLADLAAPGERAVSPAASPASDDSGRALTMHPPGFVREDVDLEEGAEAVEREVRAMARQAVTPPSRSSRRQTKAFLPPQTPIEEGEGAEPWVASKVSTPHRQSIRPKSAAPKDSPQVLTPMKASRASRRPPTRVEEVASEPEAEPWSGGPQAKVGASKSEPAPRGTLSGMRDGTPKDGQRWARTPAPRRTLTASLRSTPSTRSPQAWGQQGASPRFFLDVEGSTPKPTMSRASTMNTMTTDASEASIV